MAMSPPSNPMMYSTRVELTLNNWVPGMTQTKMAELFQHSQTGRVCDFKVDERRKTATVVVDQWYNTGNGNAALYALTFSKFFDVRVEDANNRSMFLLFTVNSDSQKKMQRQSGPPGLHAPLKRALIVPKQVSYLSIR